MIFGVMVVDITLMADTKNRADLFTKNCKNGHSLLVCVFALYILIYYKQQLGVLSISQQAGITS